MCFDILVCRLILKERLFESFTVSLSLFLLMLPWWMGCFFPTFQPSSPELGFTMSPWSSSRWCVEISLIQSPKQRWFSSWAWGGGFVLRNPQAHSTTKDTVRTSSQQLFLLQLPLMGGMLYPSFLYQAMRWALFLNPPWSHFVLWFSASTQVLAPLPFSILE